MTRSALVLVLASLTATVSAQEPQASQPASPPLTVEGYAESLERIASLLEGGRLEEAGEEARELLRAEVDFAGEAVGTDSTVLHGVASRGGGEARAQAIRVRRLAAVLRATPSGAAGASDLRPEILARLTPGEEVSKGGDVGLAHLEVDTPSIPERFGRAILAAYDWLAWGFGKVLDWLARFRPRRTRSDSEIGGAAAAAIAVVAVVVAALAVLAYRALRRGRAAGFEVESDRVLSSVRDEDPLSREVGEWEKHARDLAAAGRWREAVRAWYHAVLVCLFQYGLLHHQKGRTNWEYAARLAPENAWRPTFLDLTRLFDREWYGRPASDAEAVRACSEGARAILRAVRGAGETA